MQDESIELLTILNNISTSIFETKKSNRSRIKNQRFSDVHVRNFLYDNVINQLNIPLSFLTKEIERVLNLIPIYTQFLKHVEGLTIYDAASLICLIKDIERFPKFNNLLAYTGFVPKSRRNYNKRIHNLLLKISYDLSQKNVLYMFVYEQAYEDLLEKHPQRTKEHIHNMAKRVVVKQFLKELYFNWKRLNKKEELGDFYAY